MKQRITAHLSIMAIFTKYYSFVSTNLLEKSSIQLKDVLQITFALLQEFYDLTTLQLGNDIACIIFSVLLTVRKTFDSHVHDYLKLKWNLLLVNSKNIIFSGRIS